MDFSIPCPVHPTEKHLPRSDIRYKSLDGQVIEILNVPVQGVKTLEALLATLEIWKPVIVAPELDYQI